MYVDIIDGGGAQLLCQAVEGGGLDVYQDIHLPLEQPIPPPPPTTRW
jgi:hypothetical protein